MAMRLRGLIIMPPFAFLDTQPPLFIMIGPVFLLVALIILPLPPPLIAQPIPRDLAITSSPF